MLWYRPSLWQCTRVTTPTNYLLKCMQSSDQGTTNNEINMLEKFPNTLSESTKNYQKTTPPVDISYYNYIFYMCARIV